MPMIPVTPGQQSLPREDGAPLSVGQRVRGCDGQTGFILCFDPHGLVVVVDNLGEGACRQLGEYHPAKVRPL